MVEIAANNESNVLIMQSRPMTEEEKCKLSVYSFHSKVEMPYSWHILKPNLTSAQDKVLPASEIDWETLEFCPDDNPCFFIEPMQGTLQPDGIHEFVVTFAPHQVIYLRMNSKKICITRITVCFHGFIMLKVRVRFFTGLAHMGCSLYML